MLNFNAYILVHFESYIRNSECETVTIVSRNLKEIYNHISPFESLSFFTFKGSCLLLCQKTSQQLQVVPTAQTQTSPIQHRYLSYIWLVLAMKRMDETSRLLSHSTMVKSLPFQ